MTWALDPEVGRVIWQTIEPLLPPPDLTHPLGCHRPRVSNELCFRGILIRLVTGSSWVDIDDLGGDYFDRRNDAAARQRYLVRELEKLGDTVSLEPDA